ncbi:MAG: sulfotransferase [Candidatus Thiodiazotropha sp. (ex Lucinoma kastoroae)]|nr:sulfotransferase [Candidatus Thiodiazotropha sp. (ex Lucinoma kastoroae)]
MAVEPKRFEEKQWRKPVRYLKEGFYVFFGRLMRYMSLYLDYPRNPVFIVGCPRSGTSIFNKMIAECTEVADFSEAIYIWEPRDRDGSRDHVKVAEDVKKEDENRIKGAFGFYQLLRRKRIFVNKCPRSSVRISFIKKIFPQAKFIHVYRDGRAVVNSIISITEREEFRKRIPLGGFCKPSNWRDLLDMVPTERHAHQWLEIMRGLNHAANSSDKDMWLDVSYEEFCANPSEIMKQAFNFIDIQPTEKLLDDIQRMPLSHNEKWRKKFSLEDLELMNEIMKEQLDVYGYQL